MIDQTIHTPPQPVEAHPCFDIDDVEIMSGAELVHAVRFIGSSDLSAL